MVRGYGEQNSVHESLTKEESEIWRLPRKEAQQQHVHSIGWRLENMWPLAWVLGFERQPTVLGGMISREVIMDILFKFMPLMEITAESQFVRWSSDPQ